MIFKFIGGVLIVIGTCIGAGLLALPVMMSPGGFLISVCILTGVWLIMSVGAFYILELTQWFPRGSNLVSIAKATMGRKGEIITWLIFLLLNYTLLCAYIAGASDIFYAFLKLLNIGINQSTAALIFIIVMGYVVYRGIKSIDFLNRVLMAIKFLVFFTLIILVSNYVKLPNLLEGNYRYVLSAVTVVVTSFGFATVIPSILDYFEGDVKKVKLIIVCGSIIPLLCYILWNFVIMGTVPRNGLHGLIHIISTKDTIVGLMKSLEHVVESKAIRDIGRTFSSVCMLTSFLGVSLATTHFIADGIKFKENKFRRFKICFLTYILPLLIVVIYPKIFIIALSYAGILVVSLLVVLPAIMVWRGRYIKKIAKDYRMPGGRFLVIVILLLSVFILIIGILEELNWLPGLY